MSKSISDENKEQEMTVSQLIEKLSDFDSDMVVSVHGYEGGVQDIGTLAIVPVELNVNTHAWYYGNHEPRINEWDKDKANGVRLVIS